ncbi:MAG: hypothetical protein ACP5T0_04220 [Verrucomicrobiia bacterium]
MKKLLLSAAVVAVSTVLGLAEVILDEPFSYPDGALIQVSSGSWSNHSGTLNQVDVSNGKVNLAQNESEDVNRLLPNGPYSNATLYVSCVVNFSALPTSSGAYFLHLKDNGTMNYRARVWANTTGASSGSFRLGISKGTNAFTNVPFDLSLNTDYKIVIRYDCTTADSTLWINPVSEDSTINRIDATDSTSAVPIYAVALRQSSGMGILTIDELKIGTSFADVASPPSSTNPPSISTIPNQSIPANQSTAAIPFTVLDGETPAEQLMVTAVSDNQTLIPNSQIVLGGSGSDRTITITPAANQQGTALISVAVRDSDNNLSSTEFYITVGAPTISSIPNQIIQKNTSTADIPFTVNDNESDPATLTISGFSSNPSIVPQSGIVFGGSGANRTIRITPAIDKAGVLTISIIVSDGINYATNSFRLIVAQPGDLELYEPFDYPDGALQEVSSYRWFRHNGGTNELQVIGGKAFLTQTNSEDLSIYLYNLPPLGYYGTNDGYILYSSFKLNYKSLPTSSDYFAHYRDTSTVNFKARVFATTNGAAPGCYRIGIANGGFTVAYITNDLATNRTYTVITRYNVGTAESKIWVNATSESDPGAEATDYTPPVDIWAFSLRENSGIGSLTIDDLKIGTSFDRVYVAPNFPPAVSQIANQTIQMNHSTGTIPFTVSDDWTPANNLLITAASTNTDLIPTANIVLSGTGTNRTVTVTPISGQTGESLITITVTDDSGESASVSFLVTVLAPNNPPVISDIPDKQYFITSVPAPIQFTAYDMETPSESLTISASADNTTLISALILGGSGTNRTLTLLLAPNQTGSANVTISVSDGVYITTKTFKVNVNPIVLLEERFNYTDGSIITNSGFFWNAHSGTTGQTMVVNGALQITAAQSEDINAPITNAPFAPDSNIVLYAGLTVNFSQLPSSGYFAHFKDATTGFRCRLYATTSGAASGKFRLGVSNGGGSPNAVFPMDLSLNTPYRVVLKYNLGSAISSLWINDPTESPAGVTATDTIAPITVTSFALRQASGIGTLTVDDVIVAASYTAAFDNFITQPPALIIVKDVDSVNLYWQASATGFTLESAVKIYSGQWTPVDTAPVLENNMFKVTLPIDSTNKFFRLRK